jgi:hypothetical protein
VEYASSPLRTAQSPQTQLLFLPRSFRNALDAESTDQLGDISTDSQIKQSGGHSFPGTHPPVVECLHQLGRQDFEAPAVGGGAHNLEFHGDHPEQPEAIHNIPERTEQYISDESYCRHVWKSDPCTSRVVPLFSRRCWKFEKVFCTLAGVWQEGENGGRKRRRILMIRLDPLRRIRKTVRQKIFSPSMSDERMGMCLHGCRKSKTSLGPEAGRF